MTGATSGTATSYPAGAHELSKHLPVFSEIRVTRSLVLSFGHCGFFYLRILITLLVSSNCF